MVENYRWISFDCILMFMNMIKTATLCTGPQNNPKFVSASISFLKTELLKITCGVSGVWRMMSEVNLFCWSQPHIRLIR